MNRGDVAECCQLCLDNVLHGGPAGRALQPHLPRPLHHQRLNQVAPQGESFFYM